MLHSKEMRDQKQYFLLKTLAANTSYALKRVKEKNKNYENKRNIVYVIIERATTRLV
jgi:hypothetical protein